MLTREQRKRLRRRVRGRSGEWLENVSAFQAMWLCICFDLPVGEKEERRRATQFRNRLLDEGFTMKQWSVYMKYYKTRAQAEAAADRLGSTVPQMGKVSMIFITDKQFGMVWNYEGNLEAEVEKKPEQLALF